MRKSQSSTTVLARSIVSVLKKHVQQQQKTFTLIFDAESWHSSLYYAPEPIWADPETIIVASDVQKIDIDTMAFQATRYLARQVHKLPKRIILMRHGESLGNVDETSYANIPDWKIPLTRRGERQAKKAGNDLLQLCQGESLFTYTSPYVRTTETWDIVKDLLSKEDVRIIGTREEPRIAEQQFGNFQVRRAISWN